MEIYASGTEVIIKFGNIKAMITAATIRFGKVAYEVSYFWDGEHMTAWLNEAEFTVENGKMESIGFKAVKP